MTYKVERKTIESSRMVVEHPLCDICDVELKPVFPDEPLTNFQLDEVLVLNLEGGYGMYFDDMAGFRDTHPLRSPKVLFCKKCAEKLLEEYPAFKKVLEDSRGGLFK